ncbi:MAG: HmuY family protein [Gemmatimonadota bacterium]
MAGSLDRPRPPEYVPSPALTAELGRDLVGPRLTTVDATHERDWRFFDFSRGSLVERPGPLEWDLAFRRSRILVNGGDGFPGRGGVVDLGEVAFADVSVAPATGYRGTEAGRDSVQPDLDAWYDYGFTTHVLTPRPRAYVIRTADGHYAKLQMLSYYCPGARGGCPTFRWVYQGDGSRSLAGIAVE